MSFSVFGFVVFLVKSERVGSGGQIDKTEIPAHTGGSGNRGHSLGFQPHTNTAKRSSLNIQRFSVNASGIRGALGKDWGNSGDVNE